jgi:hypothetical protein
MQHGGLALQPGWGALEAQQALLQGGQAMGMGLAPSGLGEGTMMQVGLLLLSGSGRCACLVAARGPLV